jgi:hypothetical protein
MTCSTKHQHAGEPDEKESIMRITKLEAKLESFFSNHYFLAVAPAAPVRHPYQILLTCRTKAAGQVEHLIRTQLGDDFENVYALAMQAREHLPLTDFTIAIQCTTTERAALVRLVSRLGLEADVRSVCWQSVPQGAK